MTTVKNFEPHNFPVGVVGLGLMGCSITTCLLIAGHPVVAVAPIPQDLHYAESRISEHLMLAFEKGMIPHKREHYLASLRITEDYAQLHSCRLVIECTIENIDIKASVYKKVEANLSTEAFLATNTSAIPISTLQKLTLHPGRFFGLHWAEPAHTTRFLEIICGEASDISKGEYLYEIAHLWGKEPILVRRDIRGFVTNRLMYAMYREAMSLVEKGYATIEDVDRSCRNNAGYFMTLVGVFRWMDLTGVTAYHEVMKELMPTLNNDTHVPELIKNIVQNGGAGISNEKGFYQYTPEEAALWKEIFTEFSYEIRNLALKYPFDVVDKRLSQKKQ